MFSYAFVKLLSFQSKRDYASFHEQSVTFSCELFKRKNKSCSESCCYEAADILAQSFANGLLFKMSVFIFAYPIVATIWYIAG